MKYAFEPGKSVIVAFAHIWGPFNHTEVRLAVDTGSGATLINADIMRLLGFNLTRPCDHAMMTTASGRVSAPRVVVQVGGNGPSYAQRILNRIEEQAKEDIEAISD